MASRVPKDLTLTWCPMGQVVADVVVPTRAHRGTDYVMAFDPILGGMVYVIAPSPDTFGHGWIRIEGAWVQTHTSAMTVRGVQQEWRGFFDGSRGVVVGWTFAEGSPVGAMVAREGVRRLVTAGDSFIASGAAWPGLCGIFGYDRAQDRTVCVTPGAVYGLDRESRWAHLSASGELPTPIGGLAGSYYDTPRERLVFWIFDGRLHLYAMVDDELIAVDSRGLPAELGSDFVLGQDEQLGALLYAGPELGAFEPWNEGWRASVIGRSGPPRQREGTLVVGPNGTVVLGPSRDDGTFMVREALRWRQDGRVVRRSLLHEVRGSGGWPVMACAAGRLFAVGWRRELHTIHWTAAGWRGLVEPSEGAPVHAASSSENRAALLEGPGGALHAIFMDGAVFRLEGLRWVSVCKASPTFGPRFDLAAGYDGKQLFVFGGDVDGIDTNHTLRLDAEGWSLLPPSPRVGTTTAAQLVFDGYLGRLVRFAGDVALLGDDGVWVTVSVPGYAALVADGIRPLARDGEVLLLCAGHLYRFDLSGVVPVAATAAPEGHEEIPHAAVASPTLPIEPDVAFEPRQGLLFTSDRHDATGNWQLNLEPAFLLAASLAPRQDFTPPPPRAFRYRGHSVWLGTGGDEVTVEVDGNHAGTFPSMNEALAAAESGGWVPVQAIDRDALSERLSVRMHPLRLTQGAPKLSYLGGLPRALRKWPVDSSGAPMGHLLQVALPEGLVVGAAGLSVFVSLDATNRVESGVVVLYDIDGWAQPSHRLPLGSVELPPTKIKVRKARRERHQEAIDALPSDPELTAVVEGLGLKPPGGDKLGGTPEWVDGVALQTGAKLILQLDLDYVAFTKKQKKAWPDAALYGELYVFAGASGPTLLWHRE